MTKTLSLLSVLILCALQTIAQYEEVPLAHLELAASGGYAYRIGKKPAGQYFKDIAHGPVFTTDLTYFFNRQTGIGLKYSLFSTSATDYNTLTSNIKINFIGALYKARALLAGNQLKLSSGVGLGYMGYKDNGWINGESGTIKGGSLGAVIEGSLDYRIVKGLAIGINLSLYGGSLSQVTRNGSRLQLDGENRESLSRVEATAGLRYNF